MSKPHVELGLKKEMGVLKFLKDHGIINISILINNFRIKKSAKHEMPGFQTLQSYIYSHKENQQFELRLMQTNDFAMILAHFVAAASEE